MAAPYTQGGRRGHGWALLRLPFPGGAEAVQTLCHGSSQLSGPPQAPTAVGVSSFPPRVCTAERVRARTAPSRSAVASPSMPGPLYACVCRKESPWGLRPLLATWRLVTCNRTTAISVCFFMHVVSTEPVVSEHLMLWTEEASDLEHVQGLETESVRPQEAWGS